MRYILSKLNSKLRIFASFFIGFVLILYVSSLIRSYLRLSAAESRLLERKQKLTELEYKKKELLAELDLVSGEDFKEFQAREKLGLIKEGEYVVILPEEEVLRRLSPRELEEDRFSLPNPNWRNWIEALFGV